MEGSKFCNNDILQLIGNENELDIPKRMVKEVNFDKKYELAQLVDAPLNYLKFYLESRYFIFDKIANMMSEEMYKHTISVALTAVEIAKANKIITEVQ